VLRVIAGGPSNGEIAQTLVIEETTVKTHVKRILMKLGLRDRVHAVIYAYHRGLAHPGGEPALAAHSRPDNCRGRMLLTSRPEAGMTGESRELQQKRAAPARLGMIPADPTTGDLALAEAKLAPPRLRRGMVERPRLMQALEAASDSGLILVAAPAGYGKTTAVRAWCAGRGSEVAWVTLDAADNDPTRLWRYVATAVDRVRQGLGGPALRRLGSPGGSYEEAVDEVMNALAVFGEEVVVVLDDLQSVTDADCLRSIAYAVDRLPASARLLLVTRSDPALRQAKLRAEGRLAEVRANDLAFTSAETLELFLQGGLADLDGSEIDALRGQTEGWPAALVLALLWLRAVDDPHRAVREFGGDHRFVADYLSQEVFDSLDPEARGFLLRASVLRQFTPALCDAVFGRTGSAEVLAGLEQSNLFVIPLERGSWFRVHPLIAEYAGAHLAALEPGAVGDLHRQAAAWLLREGLPVEATEHAIEAGDHALAARILSDRHLGLIRAGAARTLLRWVRMLPDEELARHPDLTAGSATAAVLVGGRTLEMRRLLGILDRTDPDGHSPYARAGAATVRAATADRGVAQALEDGLLAVETAVAGADDALVAALGAQARARYFCGDLDGAWAAASAAVEHPDAERRAPGHAFARATLALVAVERGWMESARAHAAMTRSIVGRVGSRRSWLGANAALASGCVLTADGHLVEAERELVSAERFFADEVATVHHAWTLTLLADVRLRRGRLDEASESLAAARAAVGELADSGRTPERHADIEDALAHARERADGGELLAPPSPAELAVLRLLGTDLSARQIAGELFLSPNTVRSHTRAIYRKLGVQSRPDAVARAEALGLLAPQDRTA
jgi:LuxR family transcriptional regulator, maltose regulon positive regulatory protein